MTTAVLRHGTDLDALVADAVQRVAQAIEVQAQNAQWKGRVQLATGFALDAARNAVGGMLDLLLASDRRRRSPTESGDEESGR